MFQRSLSDDLKSLEETSNLSWGYKSQPEASTFDLLKYPCWKLLAHAGFLTPFHHDADGLSTWTSVLKGAKLWCYLRPKPGCEHKKPKPETHHLFVVLLTPGTVL